MKYDECVSSFNFRYTAYVKLNEEAHQIRFNSSTIEFEFRPRTWVKNAPRQRSPVPNTHKAFVAIQLTTANMNINNNNNNICSGSGVLFIE